MLNLQHSKLWWLTLVVLGAAILAIYWQPWDDEYTNQELLEAALHGGDASQRVEAASTLASRKHAARPLLRELLKESSDPAVVAVAIQGLAEIWDYQSMPEMIAALDHEDLFVRGRAIGAVQRIIGVELEYLANDAPAERRSKTSYIAKVWQQRRQNRQVIERLEGLAQTDAATSVANNER